MTAALLDLAEADYKKWAETPPNLIQRGVGTVFKPIEFLLKPVVGTVAPLLEKVLLSANQYIAEAVEKYSDEVTDISELDDAAFEAWLKKADASAKNWVNGGCAALAAEGAGTGFGGIALLAVDIPVSFGLILGFANRIALAYQLDITTEEIQVQIMKGIATGSETNISQKTQSALAVKLAATIVNKQTWKSMQGASLRTMPGVIIAVKSLLNKMGVNITKRKAGQLIPVIGAVAGGVINAAWGSDALEAVRQQSRLAIIRNRNALRLAA